MFYFRTNSYNFSYVQVNCRLKRPQAISVTKSFKMRQIRWGKRRESSVGWSIPRVEICPSTGLL